jgi:hypothetical protein
VSEIALQVAAKIAWGNMAFIYLYSNSYNLKLVVKLPNGKCSILRLDSQKTRAF